MCPERRSGDGLSSLRLVAAVCGLVALAGCGGWRDDPDILPPAPPAAVDGSRELLIAVRDETDLSSFALGMLALDPTTAAPAAQPRRTLPIGAGYPLVIATHPAEPWIYVGQQGTGIAAFAVDEASGEPMPISGSPFRPSDSYVEAYGSPAALAFAEDGTRLFIAHDNSSDRRSPIEVYDIGQGGTLVAPAGPVALAGTRACSLALHPGQRTLYVGSCFDGALHVFAISSTGALTAAPGGPLDLGSSSARIAMDASGQWLLGLDPLRNELVALPLDAADGIPDPSRAIRTPLPDLYSVDFAVDRQAGWVYVFLGYSPESRLARLRFDAGTGQATVESSVAIAEWPEYMALEPGGRAVHILGQSGDRITTVRVPVPPAAMTEAPGSPVATQFVYSVRPGVW